MGEFVPPGCGFDAVLLGLKGVGIWQHALFVSFVSLAPSASRADTD